ncbi:hypothetical protein [Phenylobacterium sp.]|uniref:SU10 major capsid protein n=1 Tax=Phenylobacterium sp. TaxID=1871053 RepID=UPI000C8BA752|nr:hypothetical protein [Phenylobacterium sp.]MAK81404.1 hypothetical protein [Phenylobacterium sp.]
MARNYVRTVQDMERYYYGGASQTGYTYGSSDILKADAPLLSTTAGTYQAIYGRKVWSQLNQEFNAFSILPKKPWERSGWRILTERASFTKGGGIAENGVLPDTSRPEFLHVAAKPKTVAHTFDLSEVSMFLSDKDDGMGDVRQVLKEEMGKHHAEHINRMLLEDVDTPAGNDFESLDRLVSDPDKMTTGTSHVSATTDHDIYSITRDGSAAFHSAEVDVASSNRNLSLNQMDGLFQQLWTRGGNPKVILTGYDTLMRVQQLLQSQQRFMDSKRVTPTFNGVKGVPGLEAGFIVATYNGVPMIPTKDMPDEGASSLSRIYYLDTDYLWFQTAIPTQYYESGIETGDPFAINRLGQEGLYRTMGELWCSFFGASGSIRDLQ